jgi:hypothetical protein
MIKIVLEHPTFCDPDIEGKLAIKLPFLFAIFFPIKWNLPNMWICTPLIWWQIRQQYNNVVLLFVMCLILSVSLHVQHTIAPSVF